MADKDWKKLHDRAIKKLSEEEYSAIADKAFELGRIGMKEDLAPLLMQWSGERFARSQDDEAYILRDLATTFEREANEMRAKYDEKYKE